MFAFIKPGGGGLLWKEQSPSPKVIALMTQRGRKQMMKDKWVYGPDEDDDDYDYDDDDDDDYEDDDDDDYDYDDDDDDYEDEDDEE